MISWTGDFSGENGYIGLPGLWSPLRTVREDQLNKTIQDIATYLLKSQRCIANHDSQHPPSFFDLWGSDLSNKVIEAKTERLWNVWSAWTNFRVAVLNYIEKLESQLVILQTLDPSEIHHIMDADWKEIIRIPSFECSN